MQVKYFGKSQKKEVRKNKKGEARKHRLRNLMVKNTKTKKEISKVTDKEENK